MSESISESSREFKFSPWTLYDGRKIDLIEPSALAELPEGTELIGIDGMTVVVGTDHIDDYTQGGLLAYGLPSRAEDKRTYMGHLPEEYLK